MTCFLGRFHKIFLTKSMIFLPIAIITKKVMKEFFKNSFITFHYVTPGTQSHPHLKSLYMLVCTKFCSHDKSHNYAWIVFILAKKIEMASISTGIPNGQNRFQAGWKSGGFKFLSIALNDSV